MKNWIEPLKENKKGGSREWNPPPCRSGLFGMGLVAALRCCGSRRAGCSRRGVGC
jgi:hypothetical protein